MQACREIARSKGWEVVEVCVDEPGSGVDASRPALAEALALVRSGRAQVLLAQDVERFTRFIDIQKKVKAAGANIVTVDDLIPGSRAALVSGSPGLQPVSLTRLIRGPGEHGSRTSHPCRGSALSQRPVSVIRGSEDA